MRCRKAKTNMSTAPRTALFSRVGFEPTTLCSLLGEHSTNRATRATQLVGVRIYNTMYVYIQHKTNVASNRCAMAQYTLTQYTYVLYR